MKEITQAFVLAAGVGKRLRPLTEDLPKPLIPIFQKPLITFALDHLINVGMERFVVNTHKRASYLKTFFAITSMKAIRLGWFTSGFA
jgi:Nucleoside-diphosphate-sugar pyrophosphorylase involved in lipopolysaccharide biosynthesis/translation initiation factor 2B, gamma/epsilon subunits (eIF-2Bgamma/eIF-2Bepsilon)